LLFCLEKEGLQHLKLILLQFKKDTKEPLYLKLLVDQKFQFEELQKVISYLYHDRLLSCISNYAYSKT
jgi:hypothetical protein